MFHAMNECSYQSFTLSSQTTTLTTNYGIIPTWSVSLIRAAVCSCWPPTRHWCWWRDGDATMACVLTRYNYEIRSRRRWRYCWLDVVYSAATCRMTGERRRVHTFLSSIIQTSSDPIKHSTAYIIIIVSTFFTLYSGSVPWFGHFWKYCVCKFWQSLTRNCCRLWRDELQTYIWTFEMKNLCSARTLDHILQSSCHIYSKLESFIKQQFYVMKSKYCTLLILVSSTCLHVWVCQIFHILWICYFR